MVGTLERQEVARRHSRGELLTPQMGCCMMLGMNFIALTTTTTTTAYGGS